MRCNSPSALTFAVGLACLLAWPTMASAGSVTTVSPFLSPSFSRTIHGDIRSLDLRLDGRRWGTAGAFFGVESISSATRQYLTSGLRWGSGAINMPATQISVLQTEMQGLQSQGGQILAHAQTQVTLGEAWYVPELTAEIAQLGGEGPGAAVLGGSAVRFGLTQRAGAGRFKLGYFQADPHFTALGSSIAAGESGLVFGASYRLEPDLVLTHQMRLRQVAGMPGADIAHDVVLSHTPLIQGLGRRWKVHLQLGRRANAAYRDNQAFSLELAAQAGEWRDWRIDTTVGWYHAAGGAPLGLPVAGPLWRLSATRHVNIAGFRTRVAPTFALGRSAANIGRWGMRTGLTMGFSRLSDHIDFKVNYVSAVWSGADAARGHMEMSVNYRQSTAGILAGLRAAVSKLRWPWQRP